MLTCDDYVSARTLDAAFDAMEANVGRFRLVAGATDLLPWAREGRAGDVHVPTLIDIAAIPELNACETQGARIRMGAATPFQRFLDNEILLKGMPCMRHCAIWFADDQIREQATIGGNLANASPAADCTPGFLTLDASLELAARKDGEIVRRIVPLDGFMTAPGRSGLQPDEIIVAVDCDALPEHGGAFEKVGHRRSLVISVACVAACVGVDPSGRQFEDVRLAIGGVGPVALRLHDVEARLQGASIDSATIQKAAAMPVGLVRSRSRQVYRQEVLRGFVARALIEAAHEAGADIETVANEVEAFHA